MSPYRWTHVGTPSHLGHMDRVAATLPSQAHAGAAQEAPDIGRWEGQDVPLVRPSSCNVKGGIPSSRRYLPYLPTYPFLVPCTLPSCTPRFMRKGIPGVRGCLRSSMAPPGPQARSTAPTQARRLSSSVPFERRLFAGHLAAGTPQLNPFPTASPSFLSPPLCCPLGLPLCAVAPMCAAPPPPPLPPSAPPAVAPSRPLRSPLPPAIAASSL